MGNVMEWAQIDRREVPRWYDESKFGIFVHWGLYSVPAFAPTREEIEGSGATYSEWYGYHLARGFAPYVNFHEKNFKGLKYEDFAELWRAELFEPTAWAKLFAASGAKYFCLVTKHHDGFCLFDSPFSPNWNSVARGPRRDLAAELLEACEREGLLRGVYYSLTEWEHETIGSNRDFENYALKKMIPELKFLIENYRPAFLFTDGEWDATSEVWHSREFLSWLIEESPVREKIVFNDRWGNDTRGLHGGCLTSEYGEVNSQAVDETSAQENLRNRKWEECRSISHSFAFNRREDLHHYLTEKELVCALTDTVAKGGNFLLNVSPCADGSIPALIQERLLQIGGWLETNGEAIFGTGPGHTSNSAGALSTRKGNCEYFFLKEYADEVSVDVAGAARVSLLGLGELPFEARAGKIFFRLPRLGAEGRRLRDVFTVKIEN